MYKGTWKSSTLACNFFSQSPALLDQLSFQELEKFASFIDLLSHRSYDLSSECLELGKNIFPLVGEDKEAFLSLATKLTETGWREVKSLFEVASKSLPKIALPQRLRFLVLTEKLAQSGGSNIPGTMMEVSEALSGIPEDHHDGILDLAESLLSQEAFAVPEFIKSLPTVLEKLTMIQVTRWYEEGVRILGDNKDGGIAFFKIESTHSESIIEGLSSGIELDKIKPVMEMYCRGLAGAEIKLAATAEIV